MGLLAIEIEGKRGVAVDEGSNNKYQGAWGLLVVDNGHMEATSAVCLRFFVIR